MAYNVIFSVLILTFSATFFECIGANIFIKKTDNRTDEISFECGENVTLTCMFKNPFAVEWMKEKNETEIASCKQNKCTLTPFYVGQYSISSDMLRKLFNLTILKVTKKDDGRRLVCSDGSHTDSVLLRIKDNKPRLLEDTQSGTIKAASGCVSWGTKISFKWKKISIIDKFEEEFFPKIQFENSTSCSSDADCGHDHTEIVYVTANDDGKFHFKIVALYGSEIKESDISVNKYIIETKGARNVKHLNEICVIALVFSSLSILAVILKFITNGSHRDKDIIDSQEQTILNKRLRNNEARDDDNHTSSDDDSQTETKHLITEHNPSNQSSSTDQPPSTNGRHRDRDNVDIHDQMNQNDRLENDEANNDRQREQQHRDIAKELRMINVSVKDKVEVFEKKK